MITEIKGLHHVTSMARDAAANNQFWTKALDLGDHLKSPVPGVCPAFELRYGPFRWSQKVDTSPQIVSD